MWTTAHMNFDDELIMNKIVKSRLFLFTLIVERESVHLMHNRQLLYYSPRGLWCSVCDSKCSTVADFSESVS